MYSYLYIPTNKVRLIDKSTPRYRLILPPIDNKRALLIRNELIYF